jgi:Peptidase MA superfamily
MVVRIVAALLPLLVHASTALGQGVQSMRSGSIEYRFEPGAERLVATVASRALATPLPVVPADVLNGDPPITVWFAASESQFDSLTSGLAPHWGAGVAFPDQGIIVVPAYASSRGSPDQLEGVLRHEFAHIALQRYLGGVQVPHWFTEGYATWAAGQLDESAGWILRLAFVTGRAPPLDSLALDWPAGSSEARVAYLLSASAIEFLHERGGDRVMRIFLDRWRSGTTFERAMHDVYGLSLGQLEKYWSASVRRRYGWMLFLAQSVVIWAITATIVIALFAIRRRRDRARLARMRAHEIPDDPAYWLHDYDPASGPGASGPGDADPASAQPTGSSISPAAGDAQEPPAGERVTKRSVDGVDPPEHLLPS